MDYQQLCSYQTNVILVISCYTLFKNRIAGIVIPQGIYQALMVSYTKIK